jgi:hypothetical protein
MRAVKVEDEDTAIQSVSKQPSSSKRKATKSLNGRAQKAVKVKSEGTSARLPPIQVDHRNRRLVRAPQIARSFARYDALPPALRLSTVALSSSLLEGGPLRACLLMVLPWRRRRLNLLPRWLQTQARKGLAFSISPSASWYSWP